jgi:chromosome segregation ATPase
MNVETFINNVNAKEKHLGHNKFQVEIKKMSNIIANYNIDIHDKDNKITNLENDINKLQDTVTQQQIVIQQMTEKKENYLKDLNTNYANFQNEISLLINQNVEITEKCKDLENTNRVLQSNIEQKCNTLEQYNGLIKDLNEQKGLLESSLSNAVNQNQILQLKIDEVMSELKMIKILNNRLIEENYSLTNHDTSPEF